MFRTTCFLALLLAFLPLGAQTVVYGTVIDEKEGEPIVGANIFLVGAYDGTSSDLDGQFAFSTLATGTRAVSISYLGYTTETRQLTLSGDSIRLSVQLATLANELEEVVITAGAFEASEKGKSVVLRPLDIVTTAGAAGDIVGALNTLPGAQRVGEDGRLFVRGGSARETQTFIDGMWVQNPYSSTVPDLPARGRFSPFLFKGTTFSTGGYSAEYGQALSSVLLLESQDLAPETVTGISMMTVGTGLAHTQRWDGASLSASFDYTDLRPFTAALPQNIEWEKPFRGWNGQVVYRNKPSEDELFKAYLNAGRGGMAMQYPNPMEVTRNQRLDLDNQNVYFNTSFRRMWGERWSLFTGMSAGYNRDEVRHTFGWEEEQWAGHGKFKVSYFGDQGPNLRFGAEYQLADWREALDQSDQPAFTQRFRGALTAAFAEADWQWRQRWALRMGLRFTHDGLLGRSALAPRLSLAFKTGDDSQLSLAAGQFYQRPGREQLRYGRALGLERANHLILNYQVTKKRRTLRVEGYYKGYDHLVSFDPEAPWLQDNSGEGFAYGIDLFYRDRESIRNGDFWISYSWLRTERRYLDFPAAAVPTFAPAHQLSGVYKHWLPGLQTSVGLSYTYGAPRHYHDPNQETFNGARTEALHDLSINASYLTRLFDQFTILHVSVSNVLGRRQTFGHRFSQQPGADGHYSSVAVRPPTRRFVFVGLFISIGSDYSID